MGCKPNRLRVGAAAAALLALGAAAPASRPAQSLVQPWVEQARQRYRAGDHLGAIDLARQAVARYPEDPWALELNAQLIRDAQGPVPALPLFERAVTASPDRLELLGEYAATLSEAGRNRDMLRIARRMVELDARNPRAYFLQAVLAARAGRDDIARRLLWRAGILTDPSPAQMLLAGVLELRSGSPAQAVEQFDGLARRQPDNLTVHLLLGRALLATGEANEVVARLQPLARRADASPYLLTLVGRAYEQLGRRDQASLYLDRAGEPPTMTPIAAPVGADGELGLWRAEREGDGAAAAVGQLRLLLENGASAQALALASSLALRYPGSGDVARLVGDATWLAGDAATALMHYRRAAAVRSDFALVERMALAERSLGRLAAERALWVGHLRANPRSLGAARRVAALEAERGAWRSAADLLDLADDLGGGDPLVLAELSALRLALGNGDGAVGAGERAHALQRNNAWAARAFGQSLIGREGREREAGALLSKAQRLEGRPSPPPR